jgi:hypothetical protein
MQNRPLGSDDRRLSNAVADAADLEPDDIEWLIRRKDKWGRNLQRHLADKAAAHRLAVVALEQTPR